MGHPIWSAAERKKYAKERGIPDSHLMDRRTGQSTAIAFQTFAECYLNKDKWIMIQDHAHCAKEANRHLYVQMRDMARDLNYEFDWKENKGDYFIMLKVETK